MRIMTFAAAAISIMLLASPAQASPASIAGKWKTDDGRSVISFYECGNAMCGKIDRFLVPEPKGGALDSKNPDKSKRDRKLLGMPIFWNLAPDANSFEGKGYSPEDGRYFNADVSRDGSKLKVKGCVMMFCKSVNFTKF